MELKIKKNIFNIFESTGCRRKRWRCRKKRTFSACSWSRGFITHI